MPPAGYRQFAPHDKLPSTYPNALSSFLAGAALGFRVVIKAGAPTVLQVPAGTGDDQAAIVIGGKWRYVTAPVERASPGGAAQTFDVYVTASDNTFGTASDDVGPYEVDNTDYSFALAAVASGAAAPTAALTRKVATADWDGTQFVSISSVIRDPTSLQSTRGTLANIPTSAAFGDAYYATDADQWLRYAGSKWEVMGGPAYAARARRGVAAILGTGWTVLSLDEVTYDPDGCIVSGGYVAPVSGTYAFSAQASASPQSSAFTIAAGVYKNGSLLTVGSSVTSSGLLYATASDTAVLAAGDVLKIAVFTTAVLSLNVQPYLNYLSVYRLAQ